MLGKNLTSLQMYAGQQELQPDVCRGLPAPLFKRSLARLKRVERRFNFSLSPLERRQAVKNPRQRFARLDVLGVLADCGFLQLPAAMQRLEGQRVHLRAVRLQFAALGERAGKSGAIFGRLFRWSLAKQAIKQGCGLVKLLERIGLRADVVVERGE